MFTGQKVNIQKVLELIPEDLLASLAEDTKVDYCSKVLYGQRVFNLLLYGLLTTDRTSQRTLEDLFSSQLFRSLFSYDADMTVSRSSISTRLSTIDTEFFKLAYEAIYSEFSQFFSKEEQLKHRIIRVDSSMIAETCNKLKEGLSPGNKKKNGKESVKQVKFTAAFDGLTACAFDVFTQARYTSEDWAIPEVVCIKRRFSY
ncbi:transposase [Marinilabilia sp.]